MKLWMQFLLWWYTWRNPKRVPLRLRLYFKTPMCQHAVVTKDGVLGLINWTEFQAFRPARDERVSILWEYHGGHITHHHFHDPALRNVYHCGTPTAWERQQVQNTNGIGNLDLAFAARTKPPEDVHWQKEGF